MNKQDIVDSFESILDNSVNIIDTTIDLLKNDDNAVSIPFVSTAMSVYHIGKTIGEKYHLEKLLEFIQEIARAKIDTEKQQKYISAWHANKQKRDKELEYLIIILERYLHKDMPRMLARVYLAYLEGRISWETVLRYSAIIDRLLPGDYDALKHGDIKVDHFSEVDDTILRLVGVGLMTAHETNIVWNAGVGGWIDPRNNGIEYRISKFGSQFINILS